MNPMTEWVVPIMAAAVRPCAGIGLALAPAWSVLIAGTDKTLKAAFAKRELIVEDGTAWLWLLIVGLGDALYIVLASLAVVCDETLATEVGRVVDCHSRGQPSPRSFDAPRRRSPYDRPRSLNARSRATRSARWTRWCADGRWKWQRVLGHQRERGNAELPSSARPAWFHHPSR